MELGGEAASRSAKRLGLLSPLYADGTMMCPDHGAIDHIGGCVAPCQSGQRLEDDIEQAGRAPSSITPEDAVPLAILVRQVSPLHTGSRDPHHAFKMGAVILGRGGIHDHAQAAVEARSLPIPRPKRRSVRPKLPPKASLESTIESPVKLCLRNLERYGSEEATPTPYLCPPKEFLVFRPELILLLTRRPNTTFADFWMLVRKGGSRSVDMAGPAVWRGG